MANITFNAKTFTLNEHESVLECLLRNQQIIPYACKAGTCQACLVKTVDCEATEESKKWIKKNLQAQGYTLACQWVPTSDVAARLPGLDEFSVEVSIKSLEKLNNRVMRVILDVKDKGSMFHYFPGQYLSLINPDGIIRSYSIANDFEQDQHIELHIAETKQGVFTQWLFESAKVNDTVHIRGPAGDCFYTNQEQENYPIILLGTGTGLAPLYGIIHEALKQNHQGEITLIHGGRTQDHLYYVDELRELAKQYPQFSYLPAIVESSFEPSSANQSNDFYHGSIEEVLDQHVKLESYTFLRAFLCGNPDFVHGMRKKIFLKGAKSSNIFCDPFIERNLSPSKAT